MKNYSENYAYGDDEEEIDPDQVRHEAEMDKRNELINRMADPTSRKRRSLAWWNWTDLQFRVSSTLTDAKRSFHEIEAVGRWFSGYEPGERFAVVGYSDCNRRWNVRELSASRPP